MFKQDHMTALRYLQRHKALSAAFLQRKMRISYTYAEKLKRSVINTYIIDERIDHEIHDWIDDAMHKPGR